MALTVEVLVRSLRLDANDADQLAEAARLLESTLEMVQRHAPAAPTAIKDEARLRLAGYLYDAPAAPEGGGIRSPLLYSGAAALLTPYRVFRAGVEGSGSAPAPRPRAPAPDPSAPGVDPVARAEAQAAQRAAVAAGQAAAEASSAAADAVAQADANRGFLATFLERVRAVVEAVVPAWARAADPPDPGAQLPAYQQAETQGLFSRAGALFWKLVNEVPDTPGSASGVGAQLTVTGENDQDYAWRHPSQTLPLANAGGLAFNGAGALHTSPSLVTVAAEADANKLAIGNVGDAQSVTVATVESYNNTLDSQLASPKPLILVTSAAFSGQRPAEHGSAAFDWPEGQICWVPPLSQDIEPLFVLSQSGGAGRGLRQAQVDARIRTLVDAIALDSSSGRWGKPKLPEDVVYAADLPQPTPDPIINPDYWVKTLVARTFIVHLPLTLVNAAGVVKIGLTINGTPLTADREADKTEYAFEFSEMQARNITQNLAGASVVTALVSTGNADFSQGFYRSEHVLRVVDAAPAFADEAAVAAIAARVKALEDKPSGGAAAVPAFATRGLAINRAYTVVAADIGTVLPVTAISAGVTLSFPAGVGAEGDRIWVMAVVSHGSGTTTRGSLSIASDDRTPIEFSVPYRFSEAVVQQVLTTGSSTASADTSHVSADFTMIKGASKWRCLQGIWQ